MAIGIGNLGNIIEDFKGSLNAILGNSPGNVAAFKGSETQLFNSKVGGTIKLEREKWIGNAGTNKNKVKYGFATLTLDQVKGGGFEEIYYLDIAPQSIQQKEVFATNIQATRKGVIVESEGVVFRDIIIAGTTGVFPGKRADANNPRPNTDFTSPPLAPAGVNKDGRSNAANVDTISGYEEFIRLRQFFLSYAQRKVESDGNLFLVFINEKDNQSVIVEPLDFTMDRNSKSPMTYNYRIVLKGIGDLNALFGRADGDAAKRGGFLGFLEDVGNVSANIQATIQTGRAVFNQSIRLLTRISQAVDQTINGPLRQIQFATEDINEGLSTALSLPEILIRNTTSTILETRENIQNISNTVNGALGLRGGFTAATGAGQSRVESASERASAAASFAQQRDTAEKIANDNRVPIPRSFIENSRADINNLNDNLADFLGMGDPAYNAVKGRIQTLQPDPLKVVSDDEFLVMGNLMAVKSALDTALATNIMFEPDAEVAFQQATAQFQIDGLSDDQQIKINKPAVVREIIIMQGDTLERIAQRELGDALRWLDIVVLNNLKAPYIASVRADGVKQYGDKLLIGS
jgi:hypothetical protein